jgi:hypothetical protein
MRRDGLERAIVQSVGLSDFCDLGALLGCSIHITRQTGRLRPAHLQPVIHCVVALRMGLEVAE